MKVLFLTMYDKNGPSSRVRVYQFLKGFIERGLKPEVRPLLKGNVQTMISQLLSTKNAILRLKISFQILVSFLHRFQDVFSARKYDAVVVQKDVLPFGLFWLLRLFNRNIIFEFDDAIWTQTNHSSKSSPLLAMIFWYRRVLFRRIVAGSKAVLAENTYLAAEAGRFSKHVEIISAPVDTVKYLRKETASREKKRKVVIGWLGSPGTTYLLKSLEPILNEICAMHPNIELHNIGGLPLSFSGVKVKNIAWEEHTEVENVSQFDIGLMPLDDSDFNKGRLGYKMIIYQSLSIPIVAQNLGLNKTVVTDGIDGFLVDSKNDWIVAIDKLIRNPQQRIDMGRLGRKNAEQEFDLNVCCDRYTNLIRSVAEPWQVKLARYHPGKRARLEVIMQYFSKQKRYNQCLDVGTGTGALARIYSEVGDLWDYIDPDPIARAEAENLFGEGRINANLKELAGRTYDLITVVDTFFYFPETEKIAHFFSCALKPGGELVVTLSDGSPFRPINRLRERLGIGRNARGYLFEESPDLFRQRMLGYGFEVKYERFFSTVIRELILVFLDLGYVLNRKSSSLTSVKKVSGTAVLALKYMHFLLAPLYWLDKIMVSFVRGYKVFFVFQKP